MAGVTPADIDVREIYDCYTYTALVTLEDYGFCAKGEGGELAASGALGPGGSLPTNTGGGQLSSYYLWGMTPLSEAVIQVRGQGGERQVAAPRGGDRQRQRRRARLPQPRSCSRAEARDERSVGSSATRRRRRSSTPPAAGRWSCGAARRVRPAVPAEPAECPDGDALEWEPVGRHGDAGDVGRRRRHVHRAGAGRRRRRRRGHRHRRAHRGSVAEHGRCPASTRPRCARAGDARRVPRGSAAASPCRPSSPRSHPERPGLTAPRARRVPHVLGTYLTCSVRVAGSANCSRIRPNLGRIREQFAKTADRAASSAVFAAPGHPSVSAGGPRRKHSDGGCGGRVGWAVGCFRRDCPWG